jgi:hypothetical protein
LRGRQLPNARFGFLAVAHRRRQTFRKRREFGVEFARL